MNLATKLLIGSSRVDQWRKEITTVVNMVLGFLKDEDYHILKMEGEVVLAESDAHRWMVRYDPYEGLKFRLFELRDGEEFEDNLACELPKERISLEYVDFVHAYLDSFVRGMEKLFPQLKTRWSKLLRVARAEFALYYELKFRIPAADSAYLDERENGKLVTFRKKSDLTFPLPLDTEVFVGLEGEPSKYEVLVIDGKEMFDGKERPVDDDGDCFFRVTGYESQFNDVFGDLTEEKFVMILEPQEGWENNPYDAHFLHLLTVNGWERSY
tara:strand:- start:259 stop:1065 length:807 start_codon:yes stop_codon:yes gene_type:complete